RPRQVLPRAGALHPGALERLLHQPAPVHHRARAPAGPGRHRQGPRDHGPGGEGLTAELYAPQRSLPPTWGRIGGGVDERRSDTRNSVSLPLRGAIHRNAAVPVEPEPTPTHSDVSEG